MVQTCKVISGLEAVKLLNSWFRGSRESWRVTETKEDPWQAGDRSQAYCWSSGQGGLPLPIREGCKEILLTTVGVEVISWAAKPKANRCSHMVRAETRCPLFRGRICQHHCGAGVLALVWDLVLVLSQASGNAEGVSLGQHKLMDRDEQGREKKHSHTRWVYKPKFQS